MTMTAEERGEVEADLLERLMVSLASAHFGENATAEDARAFLFKTFDTLRNIALVQAGQPVAKPN